MTVTMMSAFIFDKFYVTVVMQWRISKSFGTYNCTITQHVALTNKTVDVMFIVIDYHISS